MNKILKQWGLYAAALAIMALIAFMFFYPANAEHMTLQQHDMQQGIANSHEVKAWAEAHPGEDTPRCTNPLFGGMPTFQLTPTSPSTSLFEWLNTLFGLGLPSPSNILFMMMAGMFILLAVMRMRWYYALIGAVAWGFSTYFIIIIGAGHIWKFITLAYIPPTIAGLVLLYRGQWLWGAAVTALFTTLQIASNHVQMSYYFCFVMLAMVIAYGIQACRTATLRRWLAATAIACAAGALGLVANLPSLYNTYEYAKETIRGGSELTSLTDTPASDDGLDIDYITQYSYGRAETFSLLIPNIKGGASSRPLDGQMVAVTAGELDPDYEVAAKLGLSPQSLEAQYVHNYASQYFGEPEGTNGPVYVGALIMALFLMGCVVVKGPLKWALVTLTLLSIMLAWGRNLMSLTELFVDIVPMYSQFRTVESILVIAEFTIPLLAILALQTIFTDSDRRRYLKPMYLTFGICAFFCLVAWLFPGVYGSAISEGDIATSNYISSIYAQQGADPALLSQFSINNPRVAEYVIALRHDMVSADAIRSLIFILLGGAALWYGLSGDTRGRRLAAVGAVGILVFIDLYTVNKRYLNADSFTNPPLTAPIAMTEADRVILTDTDPDYRVLDIARFGQAEPSYYHKSVGGYHAAKLRRYQDIIDRQIAANNPAVLDMLNVRYIITGPNATDVQYNPYALGNAWWVSHVDYVDSADAEMSALDDLNPAVEAVADRRFKEMLGQPAPVAEGDTITLTDYAPGRLKYRTRSANGGVAVFSEIYFPWGWHATVDGKDTPVARADYILRAMSIPAGEHTVEMWFDPDSLHTTGIAATVAVIITYLLLGAALVVTILKRKK